jgi:hypothetical protein
MRVRATMSAPALKPAMPRSRCCRRPEDVELGDRPAGGGRHRVVALRAHMLVPCVTVTESVVAVTLPLNESDPKLPTGWALVLTAPPVLFFQQ